MLDETDEADEGPAKADRMPSHGWRLHCGTVALLTAVFVGGCRGHPNGPTDALTFAFDFRGGPQGFVAGFADYPPADADLYELTADYRALPPPLASQSALFISGVNRSDDLFMFFKRPIAGLSPGGRYIVTVSVETAVATDTPAGCFGVGGAPGESVWIKAGATAIEPLAIRDGLPAHEHRHRQSVRRRGTRCGARRHRQLQKLRAGASVGAQGLRGPANADTDLYTSQWPRLAAVRRRLGIRGPDGHLLHPGVGHLHADVTGA